MSNVLHIPTKIGTIVVTERGDDNYPGVWVELRRPDFDADMSVATIEVINEDGRLRTIVFGDGSADDYTEIIEHRNVDEWFKTS